MSTTNLFVELLVVGSGVALWILLLGGAIFGVDMRALDDSVMVVAALPGLSVVYVLGIVWDRIADRIFDKLWIGGLRQYRFSGLSEYYGARRLIITESRELWELIEYGRSRLRVCRGWALNALMIGLAINVLVLSRGDLFDRPWVVSMAGSASALVLALVCWYSWASLTKTEYRKIKEQSAYLREKNADGGR